MKCSKMKILIFAFDCDLHERQIFLKFLKKKNLFQVTVNNITYQPTMPSNSKKNGRARAAILCLQDLGLLPKNFVIWMQTPLWPIFIIFKFILHPHATLLPAFIKNSKSFVFLKKKKKKLSTEHVIKEKKKVILSEIFFCLSRSILGF